MADREQTATGNRKAEEFLELYASCEHRLFAYIMMLVGNPVDARDILQDTALTLWQKYDEFDRSRPFFTWAHEFARYRTLRYRQIHANDAPTLEPEALNALADRFVDDEGRRDLLYSDALPGCIEELSDGDRELIQLRYAGGVAVKLLAAKLNRSENAISQSLARVRRLLRKCVEKNVGQQEDPGA